MNKNKLLLTIFKISIAFIPIILLIIIFRNNVKSQQASLESQKVQELLEKNQNLEKELKIVREQLAEGIFPRTKEKIKGNLEKTKENIVEEKNQEAKTELIGVWRETSSGDYKVIWTLEKNKSTGKYQVILKDYYAAVQTTYNCIAKKLKQNEYLFHDPDVEKDPRKNGFFTMEKGTLAYFIPGLDTGADGILLLMPDGNARVYMNDMDSRHYELFAILQPIK